jgi:hypothetical protein
MTGFELFTKAIKHPNALQRYSHFKIGCMVISDKDYSRMLHVGIIAQLSEFVGMVKLFPEDFTQVTFESLDGWKDAVGEFFTEFFKEVFSQV